MVDATTRVMDVILVMNAIRVTVVTDVIQVVIKQIPYDYFIKEI